MSHPRNLFHWRPTLSTTMKTGEFTPIFSRVILPNTSISGKILFGITADVPLRPIKWDWYFEAVAFVTPRRILYDRDRYQRFITGAANGKVLPDDHEDSISANFKMPALELESVLCHMGWQENTPFDFAQTTEELRAAAMIWNQYVRNENVQDEIEVPLTSGEDDPSTWWPNYDKASGMLKVCQQKDYFTSGMTSAMKGSPVPVPTFSGGLVLQPDSVGVQGTSGSVFYTPNNGNVTVTVKVTSSQIPSASCTFTYTFVAGTQYEANKNYAMSRGSFRTGIGDPGTMTVKFTPQGAISVTKSGGTAWSAPTGLTPTSMTLANVGTIGTVDLSGIRAVGASAVGTPLVGDLRFAVQHELSKIMDMRHGNRYNEWAETHFGSRVGDNLIQIPQFVSACRQRLKFGQVLQTSAPTDDDPLGQFGGYAQSGDVLRINCYCPEESILQVFAFIRPRPGYQQGAERWRTEITRFDRYDTPYGHLGAQAVKGRELVVSTKEGFNDSDFCYQDIWDHHRHVPSRVNGLFRSNKSMWTSQRIFDPENPPAFNEDFITVDASDSSDRNFAANGVAPWVVDVDMNLSLLMPLPKQGFPGLMDHVNV